MRTGVIGALIFGLIFALIGYFVAFHFGKPIVDNARASANWPSVEGVIERSEVTTSKNSDNKTMYSADVVYRYTVDSKEYRSSTVSFGGNFSSSSNKDAYAVTNRFPADQSVTVYYETENPANAVLEPGTTWKSYLVFGIGLVFLVVGMLMLAGPVFALVFGTLVVTGAATGMIGRKKTQTQFDPNGPNSVAPRSRTESPSSTSDDDGFDIN